MEVGKPQIRVALGTVEVTDTDRRAIAWYRAGRPQMGPAESRGTATRDAVRAFLMAHGESGLEDAVSEFFAAGGQTAGHGSRGDGDMTPAERPERSAEVNAHLAREWRRKADRLDDQARRLREEGVISGPCGAEDLEATASDYRHAASELEFDGATGEGRR